MSQVPPSSSPPTGTPFISVVIASVNGFPWIGACLAALTTQRGGIAYEILVLDRCGEKVREEIRRRFSQPEIRVIPVEGYPSIPKLRAIGMDAARGRMIGILEDHCNVPPTWFQSIERAHRAGHRAIGSGVENGAVDRVIDWGVFFCEYAKFMPPVQGGTGVEIPGNCAVYDREALDLVGPAIKQEVWESFIHKRLAEEGVGFFCDPEMTVEHKREFPFSYFMSQRYHYSRSFAGMRLNNAPLSRRLVYAVATPLLPPLLLWRMATTIRRKGRRTKEFLLAVPVISIFLLSWAWGELVGALAGPGDSLARVE
jgi:Glycosyl transferase family 2